MLTVVPDPAGRDSSAPAALIEEIVREGGRRMLAEALQAEVDAYIAAFAAERDENGHRLVVRNGYHQGREVLTSAGAVEVTAPRVNDKRTDPVTGEWGRFCSAILPAWARKTPKVTEVLPLLYLHGLSTGAWTGRPSALRPPWDHSGSARSGSGLVCARRSGGGGAVGRTDGIVSPCEDMQLRTAGKPAANPPPPNPPLGRSAAHACRACANALLPPPGNLSGCGWPSTAAPAALQRYAGLGAPGGNRCPKISQRRPAHRAPWAELRGDLPGRAQCLDAVRDQILDIFQDRDDEAIVCLISKQLLCGRQNRPHTAAAPLSHQRDDRRAV